MFGAKRREIRDSEPRLYATKAEFCQIFVNEMNRLYLLSLMLTAGRSIAEQCFVGGLHIAQEGNRVFKDWAESWARRAIILNAIRMIRPRMTAESDSAPHLTTDDLVTERPEVADVIALPAFERFVFVMSVLEGYSDQECSLHLGCTRSDIAAARTRALERTGRSAELRRKLVSIDADQRARNGSGAQLHLEDAPSLAASA